MIILGSGTSHGVPVIGCDCSVCTSSDPHDKRNRSSAFIAEPEKILIDCGPEFRIQALRYGVKNVDSVFVTHSHADHIHGIDDLRIFSHTKSGDCNSKKGNETEGDGLAVYASSECVQDIKDRFSYAFHEVQVGGGKPKLNLIDLSSSELPVTLGEIEVMPVKLFHGNLLDYGYLFSQTEKDGKKHSIAYLTDCSFIPDESIELIHERGGVLDHLVIDALRERPHSTHFSFDQAMEAADKIGARHTWFIHMTHNLSHEEIKSYINERLPFYKNLLKISHQGGSVAPSFDGLVLETQA